MRLSRDDRGQTLVVVALLLTMLLGFVGLAVDVAWYELNLIRMQRAADAAALAGVVYLPGNPTAANNAALAEATQNGYTNGAGGVSVLPQQDPINNKMLGVTIQATVQTYFARIFGTPTIRGSRKALAEFVLPVPMGSPQAYYGIANLCRNIDTPTSCPAVPSATGIGTLDPQGFWGSVLTKGANRGNGDAYSTYYNGAPALNTGFDPNGYSYIVELPPGTSGGAVWLYDPIFCATGRRTTAPFQRLGMADIWFSIAATRSVTTEVKLWDMHGTPYASTDDVLIASDGGLFTNMDYVDKGPDYGGDRNYILGYNGSSSTDCATSPYHNAWWQLASGFAEGAYRRQGVTRSGSTGQDAPSYCGIQ